MDPSQPTDQLSQNTLLRLATSEPNRVFCCTTHWLACTRALGSLWGLLRCLALRTQDHSFPYLDHFSFKGMFLFGLKNKFSNQSYTVSAPPPPPRAFTRGNG